MNNYQLAGIDFHTFSLTARCGRTGRFGIGIATFSPCVGARCPAIDPTVGAVCVQGIAQPRLRTLSLSLLQLGFSAAKVLKEVLDSDPFSEYRQISLVDFDGRTAVATGDKIRGWAGHRIGDSYVAAGNVLVSERVIDEMARAFEHSASEEFEERLLRAVEAGRDAGGQPDGQTSAALLTYDREPYARVDLRVDVHEEPVGELRRMYNWFRPLVPYYNMRAVDPRIPRWKDWLNGQKPGEQ